MELIQHLQEVLFQKGILQYDMWNVTPSTRWDWATLKQKIAIHGVRNSLLIAPMPTASTSQILGNNECFEPYTSNVYNRRVLSGDFTIVNKYLVEDLLKLNLWTQEMRNQIIGQGGSIQAIHEIPDEIKNLYKTVWEIKQRTLVDMAVDRGAFIDQSQSLNIHLDKPTAAKLTSIHFHAWKSGLKTGMYYLRSQAAVGAIQFTVDQTQLKKSIDQGSNLSQSKKRKLDEIILIQNQNENENENENENGIEFGPVCRMEKGCVSCGS